MGGSLPSTSAERGSAPALRRTWPNRKGASGIRNRRRARRNAVSVHKDPDVTCALPVQHRDPLPGSQNKPSDSRLDRQTVKPSIIASDGAVGSAARSSARRARQPRRLP